MKEKIEKAYAVIDDGSILANGNFQMAIYFDRKGANNWRKDMLGLKDKDSKVVKVEIRFKQ